MPRLREVARYRAAGKCTGCGRVPPADDRKRCRRCLLGPVAARAGASVAALQEAWEAQEGRCAITGGHLSLGENTNLDHSVPKSKGGSGENNLEWVEDRVNRMKSDMSTDEFLLEAARIAAIAPEVRHTGMTGLEMIDYWKQTVEVPGGHRAWMGEYEVSSGEPILRHRGEVVYAKDVLRVINPTHPVQKRTCSFRGCLRHLADDVASDPPVANDSDAVSALSGSII